MTRIFKIKNSKEVKNTKFGIHGKYHLTYFIFIYVYQKYNIKNIKFLDCSWNNFPCKFLQDNHTELKKLFTDEISNKNYNHLLNNKMLKFTGSNRKFIETLKLKKTVLFIN